MNNDKKLSFNPFTTLSYQGDDYFCGRINEENELINAWKNGRNVTLISIRKMGKTGMIKHIFDTYANKNADKSFFFVYVDLYDTTSLGEFTKAFAEAVIKQKMTPLTKRVAKDIATIFSSIRPVITTDPLTGEFECRVDIRPQHEEATLEMIFDHLENASRECVVAFDEFQTIAGYKGCQMEATLRKHIQHLRNVHFVFAGSQKHVMTEMFLSYNRPFYQSTQMMHIDVIDEAEYQKFASRHLTQQKQTISDEAFHELYQMVKGHTWYVQAILNRLYQTKIKSIGIDDVHRSVAKILMENEPSYQMYCELISDRQREVLQAIAKEGEVTEINNAAFIERHNLGAGSTVRSSVQALVNKELVLKENGKYVIYDRFFGMWLALRRN